MQTSGYFAAACSYAAVTFMSATYGKRAPIELATRLLAGATPEAATNAAAHTSLEQIEKAFLEWVRAYRG